MALPGISNANEFYSAHYLESVLTNDIKKVRERWTEQARTQLEADPTADVSTPEAQFKALRKPLQILREAELGISGDPAERLRLQRQLFFQPLCEALGYPFTPRAEPVLIGGEAYQVPLLAEVNNAKSEPWLWVVECFNPSDEPADPLELTIATSWACQIEDPALGLVLTDGDGRGIESWEELISERIFAQEIPPRWVLAVSRDQLLLIDRQKWAASRLLRFELDTLLGDTNADALLAAATLLHREHTCPSGGGTPLLDELDENSHKHAYEVSGDLKYALRKSIELLGNEAIHWRKEQREGVFKGKTDADQLTLECLRYMYRLLFLFYIESRPDLGYAPMGSDVYRLGYSLESLRDMDSAELANEEDKESTYISDSLNRLFQMIWEGYPKRDDATAQLPIADSSDPFHDSFRLTPLKAHLFDPERMPTLTRVRFRNVVLREVIELMSLTKEGKGKRRGRVSYSQLGINQLGAVYEALLSFRGFFAEDDLYEVQPAPKKGRAAASDDDDDFGDDEGEDNDNTKASGQAHDELEVGHFVTAEQLKAYKAEEIVPDPGTGKPKCYPKGSFIYRLAGRDREKSASYYTPESLTQCLVKYALKELLPGKTAADILQLKVCEPAMGSAAFLNEVVNQLAQAYLERRQQETGRSIPHEQFATELQKVKMRLADQNVFGVDLNPVAVELAEVSLWLNSIFTPEKGRAFVPWFSQQLVCGNSLIGARRQIYRVSQLPTSTARSAKPRKLWHEHAPEELAWDAELPEDAIFHFLLPDPGMAAYSDKVIKELEPEAIERCKRWNKAFVGEAFSEAQIAHLLRLSQLVDALWKDWAAQQTQLRRRTTDPLPVWEDPTGITDGEWTPLKLKDRIQEQEVLGRDVANTNARLRLKWAMDYWCALWFWPIRQAASLPSRDTWLLELSMILGDLEQGVTPELGQGNLFADTQPRQLAMDFSDRHGFVDVEKLKGEFERIRIVESISSETLPLHWDIEFSDLLSNGGFHLVVGNPPWIRPMWDLPLEMSQHDPIYDVRFERRKLPDPAARIQESPKAQSEVLSQYSLISGTKNFLGSAQGASIPLGGVNLYRAFISKSLDILTSSGVMAILHDVGIYEGRSTENLRAALLPRLSLLFRFVNQLKLFSDLKNEQRYEMTIARAKPKAEVDFKAIFSLFHPITAYTSMQLYEHKLDAAPFGIKDEHGKWNKEGGSHRVIPISDEYLGMCKSIKHDSGVEDSTPELIGIFDHRLGETLLALSSCARVGSSSTCSSMMINEKEGLASKIIERKEAFSQAPEGAVLSGPNLLHGICAGASCLPVARNQRSYENIPLDFIHSEFRPRTVFQPLTRLEKIPRLWNPIVESPDGKKESYSDLYRIVLRRRLNPNQERTLIASIIPPGWGHIHSVISCSFKDHAALLWAAALAMSLPIDFRFRAADRMDFMPEDFEYISSIRIPDNTDMAHSIFIRVLMLTCFNNEFADIWSKSFASKFKHDQWSDESPFTDNHRFSRLSQCWDQSFFLRNDSIRRLACIEIDVLVSMALGLSLDQLVTTYAVQFPVLTLYERSAVYDSSGHIAQTKNKQISKRLPKSISILESQTRLEHDWNSAALQPLGKDSSTVLTREFVPPYTRRNRIADYGKAWRHFAERFPSS